MKMLFINASFRGSKGFTHFLISKIIEGATEEGASCDSINLVEYKMNHCIDCQVCQRSDHFLKCVFNDKDDVAMIYQKMREADLLIFATPIYTFDMSSLLKILFERYYSTAKVGEFNLSKSGLFFHHVDQDICQKPFVPLIVCDNLEEETPKTAISFFKTYSKFMDAELAGMLVRKSAGMFGYYLKENSNPSLIYDISTAYVEAGRELAMSGKITKATEKKANQPIIKIPFFAKAMAKMGFGKEKIIENHDKMMKSVINR